MKPVIKYAFAALLLLASSFPVKADYTTFTMNSVGGIYTTALAACSAYGSVYQSFYVGWGEAFQSYEHTCYGVYNGNPDIVGRINEVNNTGDCPNGKTTDQYGQCTVDPVTCSAGSDTFVSRVTFSDMDSSPVTSWAFASNGGCQYESIGMDFCGTWSDGAKACTVTYTQTDNEAVPGDNNLPVEEFDNSSTPEPNSTSDGGSTTFDKDPPVTNPDGSTSETTTETTAQTSGSGSETWETDDFVFVKDSTGTTTVYQKVKTTTTNTDGSKTTTSTETTTTTTPTVETDTIDKNNFTKTNTTVQGNTDGSTTVTTETYDANGNLVDRDVTTTGGTGTTSGGDEQTPGNCGAPGQPPCDVVLAGEENLQNPTGVFDSAVLPKFDEIIAKMGETGQSDVSSQLVQLSPLDLYQGGTCDVNAFGTNYHGEGFFPLSEFCLFYDAEVRPIFAFFFYALTVWAMYTIYVRTMRKT